VFVVAFACTFWPVPGSDRGVTNIYMESHIRQRDFAFCPIIRWCDGSTGVRILAMFMNSTAYNYVLHIPPSHIYKLKSIYLCKMTNKCIKELVGFINVFQIYSNMFRQVVAIFRGS
jgi:hypothetical protein